MMSDCQRSSPNRRNIKDNNNAYKIKSPPHDKFHSTPIKPVILQNSRSEPSNRQKTISTSAEKVKCNLSATITSCDITDAISPVRESRSPVHYYRSPVREYVSPVRNGASPILHKASSTPSQQTRNSFDTEASTLQKQRRELELLIAELRDRDRELNDMTAAHQRQLHAWEQDRQKMAGVLQKCSNLEDSLLQKNDEYRQLVAKVHVLECSEQNKKTALEHTQDQLVKLTEQNSQSGLHLEQIRDENASLNSSVVSLTGSIGEMETRETELMVILQRKDRDLGDATDHIADLCGKLKRFTAQYRECKSLAQTSRQQLSECRRKLTAANHSWQQCKKESEKHEQNYQDEHIQVDKLKQEVSAMKTEMMLFSEREKRKDELLLLQRSKQERTDAELSSLRQLYETQQKDLALLHHNLENTKEMLATKKSKLPVNTSMIIMDAAPPAKTTMVKTEPKTSPNPTPPVNKPQTPLNTTPLNTTAPRSPSISTTPISHPLTPPVSQTPIVSDPSPKTASTPNSHSSCANETPITPVRIMDTKTCRVDILSERRISEPICIRGAVIRRASDTGNGMAAGSDVGRVCMDLNSVAGSNGKLDAGKEILAKIRAEWPASRLHQLLNESNELALELENSAMSVSSRENLKLDEEVKDFNMADTTEVKD